MARVKLAVSLSHLDGWTRTGQGDLLRLAQAADDAGVDQIVLSEHVALAKVIQGHPGSKPGQGGGFPFPPDTEYPDPLIALAAIAAATTRARLSTNILIAPLRPAVLLAKMAATVDVISGGRLDLGVGTGWHREEFDALNVPYRSIAQRMDETMAACRALWAGGPATYASTTVSFTDMYSSPTPSQRRLPVWFGGAPSAKLAERVVSLGDGWTAIGNTSPADIASGVKYIRQAARSHGRPMSEITVRASLPLRRGLDGSPDLAATIAEAGTLAKAGAGVMQLPPLRLFATTVSQATDVLRDAVVRLSALQTS